MERKDFKIFSIESEKLKKNNVTNTYSESIKFVVWNNKQGNEREMNL